MTTVAVVVGDQLNFTVDENSARSLEFSPQNPDGSPVSLTGLVVEFVVEAVDGTQLVKILATDSGNPMGSVTVDTGASTILVGMLPAATLALYNARGGYVYWALWLQPGTSTSYLVCNGQITGNRTAQP